MNGIVNQDFGVEHGAELIAFTDAVMGKDEMEIARTKARLQAVLAPKSFVEVAATIAAFNVVDRIADATGIPLDPMMLAMSADVRRELHLERFASAANTPTAP